MTDGKKDQLICIIMAGGKASRFNFQKLELDHNEKPLIPLFNKPLVDYSIDICLSVQIFDKILVAVSPNTPLTRKHINEKYKDNVVVVDSPGNDYHSDLKSIIKLNPKCSYLIISVDLPTVTNSILTQTIDNYQKTKKYSLSVMIDYKIGQKHILHDIPESHLFKTDDSRFLIPIGINIINGKHIDDEYIDQEILETQNLNLLNNINTFEDYQYCYNKFCQKIYLIRHTEVQNEKRLCYGHSIIPLKDSFDEEAEFVKKTIEPIEKMKFFSSPSNRCIQLAKSLTSNPISEDERLKELNFGDWELKSWNSLELLPEFRCWADDFVNISTPSGESYINMQARVLAALEEILQDSTPRIAIVTHGGAIRIIIAHINKMDLSKSFSFSLDYHSVSLLIIPKLPNSLKYFEFINKIE
jgi:alpha-ribazole phosphatase